MQIERREFLRLGCAGLCFAAAGNLSAVGRSSAKLPNIVLCMADDQGWGDIAYNGHPVLKTPNFDALASAGLRLLSDSRQRYDGSSP